jgi:hypothetical protein
MSTRRAIGAYKRSWSEVFRGFFTKKEKEPKRKKNSEGDGLLKLAQLRKSKSDAFGGFFLTISTSCLDKSSEKTCSTYPQFQQTRQQSTLTTRSLLISLSHRWGSPHGTSFFKYPYKYRQPIDKDIDLRMLQIAER